MSSSKGINAGLYEVLSEDHPGKSCHVRADDAGIWNHTKTWYLSVLHLTTAVAVICGIIAIDGHAFQIGFGSSLFVVENGLYQAQVTALISLALVVTRLIASSCSTLLAWRVLSLMLENAGMSLGEMTRLVDWRLPVHSWNRKSWLWSLWATVTILLMWPQAFVAPLASSSVTWLPQNKIVDDSTPTSMTTTGQYADWAARLYPDWRMRTVVAAAAMTGKDPIYAFHSTNLPLRRYFNNVSTDIPDSSHVDMIMPYFAVDLRWIDATSDNRTQHAGNTEYQDVNQDFSVRIIGAIAIVREQPWDAQKALTTQATTFRGTQLIAIQLQTIDGGRPLDDSRAAKNATECLKISHEFGELPDVIQHKSPIVSGETIVAYDCYIFAEATITAGGYAAKDCDVTAFEGKSDPYATCSVQSDDAKVQDHWLTSSSMEYMSEVLKYTVLLNYSQPWISGDLNRYTSGMLALGYHAAFSGMVKTLGNDTESIVFKASTPVIVASIDKPKLYIWLGMNFALTISAILVVLVQRGSAFKVIRDPALSALTIDLSEVTHDGRAQGLCNAVTLNKQDRELGRLKWKENTNCCKLVLTSGRSNADEDAFSLRDWRSPSEHSRHYDGIPRVGG